MKYSSGFKESLLKKVLPPSNRSIAEVAKEAGVSDQSIRNWLKEVKSDIIDNGNAVINTRRSDNEKLNLIIEFGAISREKHGEWLRRQGLHSQHITQYKQELHDLMKDKGNKYKKEVQSLKKENRELQKELDRKEKALAEMSALYTLKKKAESLWGEKEDD